ncbi:MAG: SDR family NAD(P)-dependent oxidoreductase, partial [Sciscionella sp.]
MGRLGGKVVIVTGAGQGIGRAIAGKLVDEGATVVLADVNESTAQQAAAALGGAARGVQSDVTAPGSVAAMVRQVRSRFGRIDVLVN